MFVFIPKYTSKLAKKVNLLPRSIKIFSSNKLHKSYYGIKDTISDMFFKSKFLVKLFGHYSSYLFFIVETHRMYIIQIGTNKKINGIKNLLKLTNFSHNIKNLEHLFNYTYVKQKRDCVINLVNNLGSLDRCKNIDFLLIFHHFFFVSYLLIGSREVKIMCINIIQSELLKYFLKERANFYIFLEMHYFNQLIGDILSPLHTLLNELKLII